jgi:hypothetical protein
MRTTGEIVSLDDRFLSRGDESWSLYCRLGSILNNAQALFRILTPEATTALKAISVAFDESSMWNIDPISIRKNDIVADLDMLARSIGAAACPTKLAGARDSTLKGISDALAQCAAPGVNTELHPDDEASVAMLARS